METETLIKTGHGYIGFNKATGALRFTVPQGTKLADALKALSRVDLSAIAKLPRGCQPCLSGQPFDITEQFDPVINVRLGH
ncbi:hypothetical protein [Sphingomonas jaspsi]|uniref:hypothetical protein n=1 Tax=Sphingomonas jaspsi TaxID=392409 RepID=UPI0004B0E7C6|nr:hypothetical protein [Sphingomonas jaspsi]